MTKDELERIRWRLLQENADLKRKLRLAHEKLCATVYADTPSTVVLRRKVYDQHGEFVGHETIN